MSYPLKKKNATQNEYAMSWKEIAETLGISRKAAFTIFQSGIKKIKRRPGALRALKETAEFRRQMINQRLAGNSQPEKFS